MGSPTVFSVGAPNGAAGNITLAWPAHNVNDVGILFAESATGGLAGGNIPSGWAHVTNSPQYNSTSNTALNVLWRRAASNAEPNAVVGSPGNHVAGQIIVVRGCVRPGNPWDVSAASVNATISTSASIPGATTTGQDRLVLAAVSWATDTAAAQASGWSNANLTSLTEQVDYSTNAGHGGGFAVASGVKSSAGAYGNTSVTLATGSGQGLISIALAPNIVTVDVTESSSAADSASATMTQAASGSEAASASSSETATRVTTASVSEASSSSDSPSASSVAAGSVVESASAADSQSGAAITTATSTESATAIETISSTLDLYSSANETASASDSSSCSGVLAASIIEACLADAVGSAINALNAGVSESAVANDLQNAICAVVSELVENGVATDASSALRDVHAVVVEMLSASDLSSAIRVTLWADLVNDSAKSTLNPNAGKAALGKMGVYATLTEKRRL